MATVFLYTLRRFRGAIIGWGIALALLGLLLVPFYNDLVVEQGDALLALMEAYPEEIKAFMGGFEQFNTPQGFLNIEFFSYMPIIVGILAITAGAGLLVGDEEQGILDLTLAHPVSRSALFFGRLLAMVLTFVLIMAIAWAGMAIPSGDLPGVSAGDIALAYISLLSTMLFFATLALLLSMLLPSRRLALAVTGLFMVASFFIKGLAALSDSLDATAKFFPLDYYQGGEAMSGLAWDWVGGLVGIAVSFVMLAWWRFQRRDIRVGGEGAWGLSFLSALSFMRRRTSAKA